MSRFVAPNKYSFKLIYRKKKIQTLPIVEQNSTALTSHIQEEEIVPGISDFDRRFFLKVLGGVGLGIVATSLLPKKADALVMGGTPTSSVVGTKNALNVRINPATEETVASLLTGQGVTKVSTSLASSGTVVTPSSGKRLRVYASRFSLNADATYVSFRFVYNGTDFEKYLSPKTGGLYGSNNHPNYIEGGINQVLYCAISGTTTVQINIDYLEV